MAQQTINIGSAANDSTGDPLRDAFDKANDNFTELYSAVSPAYVALTSGATVTWATGGARINNATLTLAHNATLDITGEVDGAAGYLVVTQDAGTAYTLVLPSGTVFGETAIDATLGAKSAIAWSYDGSGYTFVIAHEAA